MDEQMTEDLTEEEEPEEEETMTEVVNGKEITYVRRGDYWIPNWELPPQKDRYIGVWGNMHRNWLRENRKGLYTSLLTHVKLYEHLEEVDTRATEMFERLTEQMAKQEGITEELKSTDWLGWVRKMTSVRERAREIVLNEVIYTI